MSDIQYFLHNLMDIGFLFGTILGTLVNYKRNPYFQCSGSLKKANINSNSYDVAMGVLVENI